MEDEFLELVNWNRQRILRICRVYGWNAQDEEDLYQEILFQIWRALPGLKEKSHANTWLYRVALNTAVSFVRKHTAASRGTPVAHEQLREMLDQQAHPPSRDPKIDSLYEAISQLEKMEKAVITLFLEDLRYEEISDVLGLNGSHVGVLLHRAKKKLSLLMKEEKP